MSAGSPTVEDFLIEMLALSEGDLLERLVNLTIECDSYRMLAQQAIHALHDLTPERDRLRERHHRLLDAYRHLRAQAMRQAEAT